MENYNFSDGELTVFEPNNTELSQTRTLKVEVETTKCEIDFRFISLNGGVHQPCLMGVSNGLRASAVSVSPLGNEISGTWTATFYTRPDETYPNRNLWKYVMHFRILGLEKREIFSVRSGRNESCKIRIYDNSDLVLEEIYHKSQAWSGNIIEFSQ